LIPVSPRSGRSSIRVDGVESKGSVGEWGFRGSLLEGPHLGYMPGAFLGSIEQTAHITGERVEAREGK
jgi:hypothetical protein